MSLEFDPEVRIERNPPVTDEQAIALRALKESLPERPEHYGTGGTLDKAREIVWAIPPADVQQGKDG